MNKHLSNRRGVWYFRVPTRLRKLAGKELERIGVIAVADARRYRDRRLRELSLLSLLPQQQGTLPPKKNSEGRARRVHPGATAPGPPHGEHPLYSSMDLSKHRHHDCVKRY